MKAIKIAVVMILVLNGVYSLSNWLSKDDQGAQKTIADSQALAEAEVQAEEGLSLTALTSLVKEVRSGQELERRLNEEKSINNLDLNGDTKVDYLFVREFGEIQNKIGYSVTAEPEKGEVQEIAEVTVEKNGDRAEIQVIGNEQIYGSNAIFNDWTPIEREVKEGGQSRVPMYSSYFFPHPLWISPWFFGFYPSFFSPYSVISRPMYASRVGGYDTSRVQKGKNRFQSASTNKIANPNKGRVAQKGITRSLRKPTSTQKQFHAANKRTIRSGGFGQASRSKTGSQLNKRGAGSSFGTTQKSSGLSRRSSFGSSSRSTSGSFRSRSFGSRSFSFGK